MEHGQAGYRLKVTFFVQGENVSNIVVFHDNAVNHVSDPGMVSENTLSHVIEEFVEVVVLPGADIEEMYLQIVQAPLAYKLALYFGNITARHPFVGDQNIDHLGDRPHGSAKLNIAQFSEDA